MQLNKTTIDNKIGSGTGNATRGGDVANAVWLVHREYNHADARADELGDVPEFFEYSTRSNLYKE